MFEASDNSIIGRYARAYRPSKALSLTFRVLQFLLAAPFLSAGTAKLAGAVAAHLLVIGGSPAPAAVLLLLAAAFALYRSRYE